MSTDPKPFGPDEPLESFVTRLAAQAAATPPAETTTANRLTAVGHLARALGRPPCVADLSSDGIAEALRLLCDRGRQPATFNRVRTDLLRLGRLAAAMGQLEYEPFVNLQEIHPERTEPWTIPEINLILASGRCMPDDVCGLHAGHWWVAFLLSILECGLPVDPLLRAPLRAYDRRRGTLAADYAVYALNGKTVIALDRIAAGDDRPRLFPWPYDRADDDGRKVGKPYCMLYRAYRLLLFRAGLPHTTENVFHRLRVTADRLPNVVESINLDVPFRPRQGKLVLPRPIDRRRASLHATGEAAAAAALRHSPANRPPAPPKRQIVTLAAAEPERTLRHFFETMYVPLRLFDASPGTLSSYRGTLNRLDAFTGCQTHLCQLTDELIQGLISWVLAGGGSPARANGHAASLACLWRYAWRKKRIETQPREIEKAREPKRQPRAWSLEQLTMILEACARVAGSIDGVAASAWWPAFVLLIYDTGLRRKAALALRSEDLDVERGLLFVRAETQKQCADQTFRLHPDTMRAVLATDPASRPLIFGGGGTPQFVMHSYRRILIDAGLPQGRKDMLQKLRRTSATHYCALAGEAATQKHLGHSHVNVTRAYLDVSMLPIVNAADILPRPNWRPPA